MNIMPTTLLLLRAATIATMLLTSACATLGTALRDPAAACNAAPDSATGMQLDLVRQQMNAGKFHSALAYLDTLDERMPQVQLLRARALRSIDDSDGARHSYDALLNTCLRPYGEQGLGIIAADRHDLDAAIAHLKTARELAPVDAEIRNDYGFALLAAGMIDAALREFHTAVELEDKDSLALRNLVLTLFIAHRADAARDIARQHALNATEIENLAQRADNFRPIPRNARTGRDIEEVKSHAAS